MLKPIVRRWLRRYCLTPNTVRYVIEYRSVKRAFERLSQGGILLDAGAGSGEMSLKLYREGFCSKLIGVEPFESNYKLLVQNYAECANVETCQAPLEKIPAANASVDYVLSTQVFEHIKDHDRAAAEVVRVLKPGGHLIISVPHPPERFPNEDHVRPGYTEEDLVQLFSPLGMEHLLTDYFFTLPTQRRLIAAGELPFRGIYLPIAWADREKHLSNEERRHGSPGAILCLFGKRLEKAIA